MYRNVYEAEMTMREQQRDLARALRRQGVIAAAQQERPAVSRNMRRALSFVQGHARTVRRWAHLPYGRRERTGEA